jgi:hypothetical protein
MTKNSSFLCFRAVFASYCPLFWHSMEIHKEYKSLYIPKRNDKKDLSFLRVWSFSWAIAHSFGVLGLSTRPTTLSTCLRGMTKNSSFLHFRAVFVSYYPQFWDSGVIYKAHYTQHIFQRPDQKLVVFCILGPFSWAIAHSFGFPEWLTRSMTLSTCLRGMTKNSSFLHFRAIFVSYCPLFWGSVEIYQKYDSLYILERNDKKNLSFLHVRPFSWAIAYSFGVLGWSTRPMTLSTCLRGMINKLIIFAY